MTTINPAPSADTAITIKIALSNGESRRFKLTLKDLGANTLPDKLRQLLAIPANEEVIFERFSDSAGTYILLDSNNPSVYKQLYRAAKAKSKLRIKVSTIKESIPNVDVARPDLLTSDRLSSHCYVPPMNPEPLEAENKSPASEQAEKNTAETPSYLFSPSVSVDKELRRLYVHSLKRPVCCVPSITNPKTLAKAEIDTMASTEEVGIKKEIEDEAPVPRFISAHEHLYAELAKERPTLLRSADQTFPVSGTTFTICCNNCDVAIPDAHWHCSICDNGDFDLCAGCVDKGILCGEVDHWLIKRFVQDGKVINSTTETIAPKKLSNAEVSEKDIPGAFTSNNKVEESPESLDETRTCNSCVGVFTEPNFVTCTVCDDYDLCIPCHVSMKHGHHPSHALKPASNDTVLDIMASNLCAPGRNMRHFAICDGCDKDIYGVRHKCINCPDWDYCSACIKDARHNHPGHRFVPLYEPVQNLPRHLQCHYGINCDGPLCKGRGIQSYIVGDRYKCAVCHDTDFCANCEALPTHRHNRTHPLIKFKSPVRNVSVTTLSERGNGEQIYALGDQIPQTVSKSTETKPTAKSTNAATQVQTIAEVKPTEPVKEESKAEATKKPSAPELQAHFVRDVITDGSVLAPSVQFKQAWTLRNPGPQSWPAGCCVRFVGGDAMFNVDPKHPSSVSDIDKATESNVIDRVVDAGEEVDFAVVMRSPENNGRAISYWRLKTAEGLPFGHKLWCDIKIRVPEPVLFFEAKTEHIEDIAKHDKVEEVKAEEAQSQMIFPKLDKESPASSAHEAEAVPTVSAADEKELLEDVESFGLEDEDDTDDAFLTDEEYELLDTSDTEFFEAPNGKK